MRNIPSRLKAAREAAKVSVTEMARRLKVERKVIYRLEDTEKDYPIINTKYVDAYANEFNLTEAELVLGYDPRLVVHMLTLRIEEMGAVLDQHAERANEIAKQKRREFIDEMLETALSSNPFLFNTKN